MSRRVALYCIDYHPSESGYSYAFQNLVAGLLEADPHIRVDVFTPRECPSDKELSSPRLRVIRLPGPGWLAKTRYVRFAWANLLRPYYISRSIRRMAKLENYEFIVFESFDDPLVFACLPPPLRRLCIVRVHATSETEYAMWAGGWQHRMRRALIRRALRADMRLIAATCEHYIGFVKRWFLDDDVLLAASKRFRVVPNALSMGPVSKGDSQFSGHRRTMLTLGRMDDLGSNQKGFDDVIAALDLLPPDVAARLQMTFIGTGSQRNRLQQLARQVSHVEFDFIEWLPNAQVHARLAAADVVLLASRYEGMSVFAMEALAFGCPVIFSYIGGLSEMVDGNGCHFPPGDVEQLARCISRMVSADAAELAAMSRRSAQIASQYTPVHAARRLLSFAKLL